MRLGLLLTALPAIALACGPAAAQTAGIGTTATAYTFQAGSAISKVVSSKTKYQLRVQTFGGSGQYVPMTSSGQLEFALANELETHYAVTGTVIYKGQPQPDLQVAAVLTPFQSGVWAKKGSNIKTAKDLKGKRVGAGYASQQIIAELMKGVLANGGLSYDDVQQVPTSSVVTGADDFAAGKTDAFFFALGAAKVQETDAKVPTQFVSLDPSPEAVKRMKQFVPPAFAAPIKPSPANVGVTEPGFIQAYYYLLLTHKKVSADMVYATVKAMAENKADLAASFPALNGFDPKGMTRKMDVATYHPGAIKYFQESGQWPPK